MSPSRTVGDDPDSRVEVGVYSDLAAAKRGLTTKQADRILDEFKDGVEEALVIEDWADDKDLPRTEGLRCVYFGETVGRSEKAWRFASGGKVAWVPKSLTTVFENCLVSKQVERSQRGLGDFATDAGGRS